VGGEWGGGWVVMGGGWWLVVGGWWRLVAGGGRRVVGGGGWWAMDGPQERRSHLKGRLQ